MHSTPRRLASVAAAAMLCSAAVGQAGREGAGAPRPADLCRADLAKRLHVAPTTVSIQSQVRVTWPDAALGLPEPDRMYAQVQSPGLRVILQSKAKQYLYTTGPRTIRYGGPVQSWLASAVCLQPIENEPNLNADLVQMSLVGTNPTRLLSAVTEYYPQPTGAVVATRRTSRSGFDLLFLGRRQAGSARKVASAFAFGAAAASPDGRQWAAFVRPGMGRGWILQVGSIEAATPSRQSVDLPEGCAPRQVGWDEGTLFAELSKNGRPVLYEVTSSGAPALKEAASSRSPFSRRMALNKSEWLEAIVDTGPGGPTTRVVRRWFTGDENPVATIKGFAYTTMEPTGAGSLVFLSGKIGDKSGGYAVDIVTGEVLPAVTSERGEVKLLLRAPIAVVPALLPASPR